MPCWIPPGEAAYLAAWAEDEIPHGLLLDWLLSFPLCARVPLIAALRVRALAALAALAALDERAMTCQ